MIAFTCRRLRPALVDLAEGTLANDARSEVDAHLAQCPACRDDLVAMQDVSSALRVGTVNEPDADFWRRQIMRRIPIVPARPRSQRLRLAVTLAAAMLAAVVVRTRFVTLGPATPHAVERLDDEALFHLDDLLPALVPSVTIEDADGDLLGVHELGHEKLDSLSTLVEDVT